MVSRGKCGFPHPLTLPHTLPLLYATLLVLCLVGSSHGTLFLSTPCKITYPPTPSNLTWYQTQMVTASWVELNSNFSLPYVTINLIRPNEVHTIGYYMPNTNSINFQLALHFFMQTPDTHSDWQIQVLDARDLSGLSYCTSPSFTIIRPAINVQLGNASAYYTEGTAQISWNSTILTNNTVVYTNYTTVVTKNTTVVINGTTHYVLTNETVVNTNSSVVYNNVTLIDDVILILANNHTSYLIGNYSSGAATYNWTGIPFEYESVESYTVQVCWADYPTICGESVYFIIQYPNISVVVPYQQKTGNEILSNWQIAGREVVGSVSVMLFRNYSNIDQMPVMCSNVTSGVTQLCDFWYLPYWLVQDSDYTVGVCWDAHPHVCGFSTPFLLTATIQVHDVVETGVMLIGAPYEIDFTIQMQGVDAVNIDLDMNSVLVQNIVTDLTTVGESNGTYTWVASTPYPASQTQHYTVRVTFPSLNPPFGSCTQFIMINQSQLAPLSVINPTSNTAWDSGNVADILWLSVDQVIIPIPYTNMTINNTYTALGRVSIDLFNNGAWQSTIDSNAKNVAGENHYNWTVPDGTPVASNYTIRVCYVAGLEVNVTCSFSLSFAITGVEKVPKFKIELIIIVAASALAAIILLFTIYIKCIRSTKSVRAVYSCSECATHQQNVCVTATDVNVNRGHTPIITNFTHHFPAGQFTVLKGPSGCGKSTLLEVLNGIYNSSFFDRWGWSVDGGIFYVPEPNFSLNSHEKCVGYVPQFSNFYPSLTTEANLYYGAKIAGAQIDKYYLPNLLSIFKLDARRKVKVEGLSGGQQKRLSIAMALVRTPRILWLDEPTSGLDDESAEICCKLLRWLADNCKMTVVAVIHQDSAQIRQYFHSILELQPQGAPPIHRPITQQDRFSNYLVPNYNLRVAKPKKLGFCSFINIPQCIWLFLRALSQSFQGVTSRLVDVLISFLFTTLFAWMVGGEHYQGPMDGANQCIYPVANCQLLRPIMELPRNDPIVAQGSLVLLSIAFTGLMASMRVFSPELKPFLAEKHETTLSHGAYFFAKHLVEAIWSLLPASCVVIVWSIVVSLVSDEALSIPHFFPIALQLWIIYWICMEIGFILSISMSIQASLVIGAGILNVFFVFNGIRPPIPTLAAGSLRALLYHFSFFRFALENYYIVEIKGQDGADAGLSTWGYDLNNYNKNLGILFLFWLAFAVVAYIALTIRISLYSRTGLKPTHVSNKNMPKHNNYEHAFDSNKNIPSAPDFDARDDEYQPLFI